jgi:hypothetical protein
MLKVTLIPGQGPRRGRLNSKVLLQFQGCFLSYAKRCLCPLHKKAAFAKDIVGEPDHGGIDRRLARSTSYSKPRCWMPRVISHFPAGDGLPKAPGEAVVDCGRRGGAAPGPGFVVGLIRLVTRRRYEVQYENECF